MTEKDIVRKLLTKLLLKNEVHFGPFIGYNPICVTGIYSSPFVFDLPVYRLGIPHSLCSDGDSPSDSSLYQINKIAISSTHSSLPILPFYQEVVSKLRGTEKQSIPK